MTATKNFRVDSFVSGLAIKAPVNVATDLPITLSAEQTVNGVPLLVGDRALVKDQVDPLENGIYNVETSAWQRSGDFDGNRDVVGGTVVPAYRASDGEFVYWIVAGNGDALEVGTDAFNFSVYYDPASSGIGEAPIDGSPYVREDAGWVAEASGSLPAAAAHSVLVGNPGGTLWIEAADITFPFGNSIILDQATSGQITFRDGAVDVSLRNTIGIFSITASVALDKMLIGPDLHLAKGFYLGERASAEANRTGLGQFWTQSEGDNVPMFTSSLGTEQLLDPSRSDIISVVASRVGILADKGKTVGFSGSTAAQTMTIPAESSVPYKIGTFLGWDNNGSVSFDIAITTDTLIFADDGTTGTRTLLPDGMAVAHKIAAATWKIAGRQLT